MKRRILAFFLVLILLLSLALPAGADSFSSEPVSVSDLQNATRVITNAISQMQSAIPAEEAASFSSILGGFMSVVSTGGTILTAINGSVNFLKLIGLVRDQNTDSLANISTQLQGVTESMERMDRKLNDITAEMSRLQATEAFHARIQQAMLLQSNWNDFEYRYGEEGMDALMTQYQAMLLNGLQLWCMNQIPDARTQDGIDNTKIILLYRQNADGWELIPSAENSVPAGFPEDGRYLILPESFLPAQITWNDATDERNVARYLNEVEQALAGTMNVRQMILVGKPTEVLKKYMQSDSPIYIAQSIAKK